MVNILLRLHKRRLYTILGVALSCFICGFFIDLIYYAKNPAATFIPFGMLLGAATVIILCIASDAIYAQGFSLALRFGKTRRDFMISYTLELLIWALLCFFLLIIMSMLEYGIYLTHFSGIDRSMAFMRHWLILMLLIPVTILVHMFFGTLYSKWGTPISALAIVLLKALLMSLRQAERFRIFKSFLRSVLMRHWTIPAVIGLLFCAMLAGTILRLGNRQTLK